MPTRAKLLLAAEILITYCRVRWAMRRQALPDLVAAIRARRGDPAPLSPSGRRQLAGAVMGLLAVLPTDSRCLVRSLVYLTLLQRRGTAATLVIGVRTEPEFAAHAWVEHEGEPLLPEGDGEYAPLTVI